MTERPRVTVLQLDPTAPLGAFEGWLPDAGVRPVVVPVWERSVPGVGAVGDGLIVLGGQMSAHARVEHPWLDALRELVLDAHALGLPTLGICLGHQVLAEALGGEVVVGHEDGPEEGATTLHWLPEAADDPLFGPLAAHGPATVVHSHHDAVARLPAGAVELARTAAYGLQVFRSGSSWGVQFHPEATTEMVERWSERSPDRDAIVASVRDARAALEASGRAVADGFARVLRG